AARLRFHTQTGGATLTAQQPLNNVVRVAIQAMAAVLGGTQSLHTNSYDEALALPTELSSTLALRTQQLLASETGVPDVVDPLGGSWYLEALTDKLEAGARQLVEESEGGGRGKQALGELEVAARAPGAPLMEPILDAVRARATLGEISDVLRAVWGVNDPR